MSIGLKEIASFVEFEVKEGFELPELNLSLPDQNVSLPEQNIPNTSCELTYANLETVRNLATNSAELDFSYKNDSFNIIESLINSEFRKNETSKTK